MPHTQSIALAITLLFLQRCLTFYQKDGGARRGVVLRHYATNRQVAGSIPDGVIGIFQ